MKKLILLITFVLLTGVAACSSGDNVATAVQYINALEEGDIDSATSLACPERSDEIMSGLVDVTAAERGDYSFETVSCAARGSGVACSFTIVQQLGDETPSEFDRSVIFEFDGGQICGFEEEVAS
ncbi:MAG: hypothetical protein CL608_23810 [Anaerolineaceae bacterium]|nr:hypothetical protein [Anaerolineaceae bacterium]